MIPRRGAGIAAVLAMGLGSVSPAWAQTPAPAPVADAKPEEKKEDKPKTLWDEFKLGAFIEQGATFSLHGGSTGIPGQTSSGYTNELRYYDITHHQLHGVQGRHAGIQLRLRVSGQRRVSDLAGAG